MSFVETTELELRPEHPLPVPLHQQELELLRHPLELHLRVQLPEFPRLELQLQVVQSTSSSQ